MATLEKIRSKSVFLIVVIGVALLAFIIGDALTNGRNLFGDHTTIAKIGSQKIDYTDYQRKREELNNQLEQARRQNPAQYENFDTQILAQMAIDQLIDEKLLDEAVENTGISTSADQLRYYMFDQPMNPNLQMFLQQMNANGISVATPQQAHEIIFNPKRNGRTDAEMQPYQRAWLALEAETKQIVKRNTYQRLLYGTLKANELDKKALYNDYISVSDVDYAFKPFGPLDEKKYPVSEQEVKDAYAKDKNRFKVNEETKQISFIAVNINPSQADIVAAQTLMIQTIAALNDTTPGADRNIRKEGIAAERMQKRASDLQEGATKAFVATAPSDSVKVVAQNPQGFTIVKMGSRTTALDSLKLNIVQVAGATLPDKVLARLNGGLAIDSITSAFSADSVMPQKEQWIPLYTAEGPTNALEQSQIDSLTNAGGRFIKLVSQPQGAVLAQVVEQKAPVTIYEFEEYNYSIKPSTKTVNQEREKLEKFLADNNTAEKFRANAAKNGYSIQNFDLTQSSVAIPRMAGMQSYYPESRQVVRWVMIDGKPGEVSHVYECKDVLHPALYAAAVDAEFDDYLPVSHNDVRSYLTDKVRREKAGADMVKAYKGKGKTVADVAKAMGVAPQNIPAFRFARNASIRDTEVTGKIAGTKAGAPIAVVSGENGVYVFFVKSAKTDKFPYTDSSYEQQFMMLVNPDLTKMLRGAKPLVNKAYKFEAGE